MSTVIAGLRQQPQDRTLRNFMNQLVADADTEALAARATAVRSGVPELDGDNFKRADQQQQEGRRLRAAGRTSEAVRALWTAADLYAVGARRADEARSRRAASPGAAGDPRSVALDSPPPRTEPPPVVENRPDPEPPPRSPAAPPPPAVVSPDAGIQETIARYATAYESRNPAAVKQVQPSIDENALQTAFRDMRGLSVAVSGVQIQSTDGSTARVAFRIVQTVTGRSGQRTTTTRDRVARLKRTVTASWVIEGFDR